MTDLLTREMIKRIFANIGLSTAGGVGITDSQLKLSDSFVVEVDEGAKVSYPMYGGKIVSHGINVRALCVDLTDNRLSEFALCFRSNGNPIYGLRLCYDNTDDGLFLLRDARGWSPASIVTKCRALAAMETICSHGLLWEPLGEDSPDLADALASVVMFS